MSNELNETPKTNPTIEKWRKYYQDKKLEEVKELTGLLIFTGLNPDALKAEMIYYASIQCETRCGMVSIQDLRHIYMRYAERLLEDKREEDTTEFVKIWKEILDHPMYPLYDACAEAIRALEIMETLPPDVREMIL